MKFIKGTLALALTGLLAACGGGGSDGYYNNQSNSGGNNNGEPTTPTDPGTPSEAQSTLNDLKKEGQFLFGNYDPTDENTKKGYIDHAMDTFSQGPLQLAIDAKKVFDARKVPNQTPVAGFEYRPKCMDSGTYANTACYILFGESAIKSALASVNSNYSNWDFDVNDDEISGLKLSEEQINHYTGKTMILIFDNRNADKKFNDVWVTGVFGYPYKQSWGLEQKDQLRIVSMNETDSNYQVTIPYADQTAETKGALSIYKDPTATDGSLYVLQNNSGFDVLINDNPSTPEIEPVGFTVNSIPGDATALATYKVNMAGIQILDIPSITAITGSRIENQAPSANDKSFTGSIFLKGPDIFTFKNSLNGTVLDFKHIFNNITFEGQSVNNNGTIKTTLTQPSGVTY